MIERKDVHKQRHRKKAVRELYTPYQTKLLTNLYQGLDLPETGKPDSTVRSLVGRGLITVTDGKRELTDFGRDVAVQLIDEKAG